MSPELKAEWVAALRSGKYEQGRLYLNRDGKYCCLGVLCELAGVKKDSFASAVHESGVVTYIFSDEEQLTDFLGTEFMQALGLERDTVSELAGMNDGWEEDLGDSEIVITDQRSFAEIADVIEERL